MGLPSPYKPSRFISPLRARQLHRALKNLKLTLICGLLTILVLRGALGAGKFGTPAKDFEEIKHQFERVQSLHARKHVSRVLAEVVEERQRPLEAIQAQAHSTVYYLSEKANVQSNDGLQEGKYALKGSNSDVLSPRGPDWNAERRGKLRTNANHVGSKPKIMLVTGYLPSACEDPTGDHYLLKFVKNKVDYCKLHGIEILYNSAIVEAELSGLSAKLRLLRRIMLAHPEVEWFWWIASDALFTDMAFQLPMEKYENYNVVFHGLDSTQKTGVEPTSSSFLIRNCQWSLHMLDTYPQDRVPVEAGKLLAKSLTGKPNPDDRPMFAHLLINEKANWGEQVPSEKSIFLHGHWEMPVNESEEEMNKNHDDIGNESRPFVTRFIGHKLCNKKANALYFKHMERALEVADSQVRELNSFQRKSPSLNALQRLRGGHDGIRVSSSDVLPSTLDQSNHITHSLS